MTETGFPFRVTIYSGRSPAPEPSWLACRESIPPAPARRYSGSEMDFIEKQPASSWPFACRSEIRPSAIQTGDFDSFAPAHSASRLAHLSRSIPIGSILRGLSRDARECPFRPSDKCRCLACSVRLSCAHRSISRRTESIGKKGAQPNCARYAVCRSAATYRVRFSVKISPNFRFV